jgi:hypothetical protein
MSVSAYSVVMTMLLVVGVVSGVYFLASWSVFHVRYGKHDRRRWSWDRIDALAWVAVFTGFWLLSAVRVVVMGGWPHSGESALRSATVFLSALASGALLLRAVWWSQEVRNAREWAREVSDE